MTMYQLLNHKKGFTLIELLVVISIISLLASVVLSSLNYSRLKAQDSERLTELKQLSNALEQYHLDHGFYPASDGWILTDGSVDTTVVRANYLSDLPNDPNHNPDITTNENNYTYIYYRGDYSNGITSTPGTNTYCLYTRLSNPTIQQELTFTSAIFRPTTNYGMNYAICSS